MLSGPTTSGIYAIKNGERAYIGQAVNIHARWRAHSSALRGGRHDNPHLQRAWDKHGAESFEFVVLEECLVDHLVEREQYHLDQYSYTYNCGLVSSSPRLGVPHTPETKSKISAANSGRKLTVDARANISRALIGNTRTTGRALTSEHRAKISEANKGNTNCVGRKATPEARANMSKAQKDRQARLRLEKANGAIGVSPVGTSSVGNTDKPAPTGAWSQD